jgi:hypothetical protein
VSPALLCRKRTSRFRSPPLRKALGADRNLIRTEFGRGYRFIGMLRWNATAHACRDDMLADKDPSFRPKNFCRVIRGSAWSG